MATSNICPFFGKDDDYCDVGCGYISTYDVDMIIHYCNGRYNNCAKFMELADRLWGRQGFMAQAGIVA